MFRILALSALVIGGMAQASELDRDVSNIRNPEFNGTVILKVDKRDGAMKMVRSNAIVGSATEAKRLAQAKANNFTTVPKSKVRSELDRETGSSSWYYYYNYGYSYPYYYGYYNYYQPYYSYNYGYYNYYYYGWYYYW